jgi:hypothetical protein
MFTLGYAYDSEIRPLGEEVLIISVICFILGAGAYSMASSIKRYMREWAITKIKKTNESSTSTPLNSNRLHSYLHSVHLTVFSALARRKFELLYQRLPFYAHYAKGKSPLLSGKKDWDLRSNTTVKLCWIVSYSKKRKK